MAFDPEFDIIINCEALKQVYDTSSVTNFLDSKPLTPLKYPIERKWVERYREASLRDFRKLFEIDYSLIISKFIPEYMNYTGTQFFGSKTQIDAIINAFKE